MTLEEYIQLLESPSEVDTTHIEALQDLLRYAPYCASAQLLLLKAIYSSGDRKYMKQLERSMLVAPPESSVYFLLNPKKVVRKPTKNRRQSFSSDPTYFELLEHMQDVAKRKGLTFEELAQRYLDARKYVVSSH